MAELLVLLGFACFFVMIVGLFKPNLVIRWGEKKTRLRVLLIYGGLFIVLAMTGGTIGAINSDQPSGGVKLNIIESEKKLHKPTQP